jgi:chemotaxis protein CheX
MIQPLPDRMRKVFTDSSVFTFAKMIVVDLAGPVVGEKDTTAFDISAVIGFSGDIVGNCALRMSFATAQKAVTRLAGEPVGEWAAIADGVGELVNMIAGNAKAALDPYKMSLSFPKVIRGADHEIGLHRHSDLFELNFASELGPMAVIVAFTFPRQADSQ